MALHIAGTIYEHREVLLRDKPAAMLEASPKGSVPVFILKDGTVIDESLDIMRWACPDTKIDPKITSMIDGPFKHHLDRYKYASRYDDTAKRGDVDLTHRAAAIDQLKTLEFKLADSSYLEGDSLGLTDISAFPFVRQFAAVEPDWWSHQSDLNLTRGWLEDCIKAELFAAIMIKYKPWAPSTSV